MNKHNRKIIFDFGHFWAITGQKTEPDLILAKNQAKIFKNPHVIVLIFHLIHIGYE